MSSYSATVSWRRQAGEAFTDRRYSRAHTWHFDGGVIVPASSSPHHVPLPFSDPSAVDPEEAYVAALASCHMLGFLYYAALRGFTVSSYTDDSVGVMGRDGTSGKEFVTHVTLRPRVVFSGERIPAASEVEHLHHEAHEACYLAHSVKTVIDVQGTWEMGSTAA